MDWSGGEMHEQQAAPGEPPRFPRLSIGYLLGFGTLIAEIVAASLHPELGKETFVIAPLYVFLPTFVGLVYWLVCIYDFHLVLIEASAGTYSIKPVRAAWFHLIPIFQLYWAFKWSREVARFVNARLETPLMSPGRTGFALLFAYIVFLIISHGFGLIALFWALTHLVRCLRFALSARPAPPAGSLPLS